MNAKRQAKRDRAVLDRMTKGPMKLSRRSAEPSRRFDEQHGTDVQRALRKGASFKEYGGLPGF